MKRENGYYFVKDQDGEWSIAEWNGGRWYCCGIDYTFDDEEWTEIDERRVVREETQSTRCKRGPFRNF
jgi:hypothetical protein